MMTREMTSSRKGQAYKHWQPEIISRLKHKGTSGMRLTRADAPEPSSHSVPSGRRQISSSSGSISQSLFIPGSVSDFLLSDASASASCDTPVVHPSSDPQCTPTQQQLRLFTWCTKNQTGLLNAGPRKVHCCVHQTKILNSAHTYREATPYHWRSMPA